MDEYIFAKYIRLSTEDSKSDSMSIENQRLMLDRYIANMDIPNITVMEFVDNGYSGTNFERPAVQELLDLVRAGKINCIIVKDFSRFGRNAMETGYFLERVFPLYRTRFISVCDYYDSDEHEGGTGGIEVALKFLVHEHYSRDLSRKIKAAKHERKLRGESVSKNCAFGFVKTKDNKLEIDPDAADTVRLIFNMTSEGKSLSVIERELYEQKRPTPAMYKNHARRVTSDAGFECVWGKSVILKVLRDEQYTGTYIAGKSVILNVGSHTQKKNPESEWIRIPGHHPAIIERELFDKVQTVINIRGEPLRGRKIGTSERYADTRKSPLSGKVVCGCCGHTMTLSTTKNAAFHCSFTRSAPDAECHRLRIIKSELESTIFEIISKQAQIALNVDNLSEMSVVTLQNSRQSECKQLMEQADNARCNLYEQFVLNEINADEYMSRKAEIDAEIDRLNRVHTSLSEQLSQNQSKAEAVTKLNEVVSGGNCLSQPLVDLLIEKVRVYPENRIEVQWKIAGFYNGDVEVSA